MTDELKQKAENFIIDRYKLNECYREDNEETRGYMRMDVHSQYEEEYQLYLAGATEATKELEQQIEKMKNWCNCKNYQQCLIELAEQGKGMKPSECCVNCKKWELEDYRTRKKK